MLKLNLAVNNAVRSKQFSETLAKAAFDLLGEKCRQLLILFYFKRNSFREIASLLKFGSEETAKNQKYRCIQKAKENYLILSKTDTHE